MADDPLLGWSDPAKHWTTANVGEAVPGILSPLGWSIWGPAIDGGVRGGLHGIGVLSRREAEDPETRMIRVFHGRAAVRVETLMAIGDRLPGTSGRQVLEGLFGEAPDTVTYAPTRRRIPIVAARLPYQALTVPRRAAALARDTEAWWRTEVAAAPSRTRAESLAGFDAARQRFELALRLQGMAAVAVVQPIYDALDRLCRATGVGSVTSIVTGYGDAAESQVVVDLWLASRGELTLAEVVGRHGFHGPDEGEISGRVWREDDAPLRRMVTEYERRPDSDDPRLRTQQLRSDRQELEARLLGAVASWQRPAVRALLGIAPRRVPLRGLSKMSFLQSLDVLRASARRLGVLLAEDGRLEDPDDVFMLTADELVVPPAGSLVALVGERREQRALHERQRLPVHWRGMPSPTLATGPDDARTEITGTGVSPGVVEGVVRVVRDPSFEDVEPGEILVAPTTDPSWASIMFLSSALVVDIGGPLSHAAVVARELGVPCVVNTRDGSDALRTGDRVRVDGGAGTVAVLERAGAVPS